MSKSLLTLTALCCALASLADAAEGVDVRHSEPLSDYTLSVPGAMQAAKPTAGGPVEAKFLALGRSFDLTLEPNARLDAVRQQLHVPAGVVAYRGTVAGTAKSWVRLVVGPDGPSGLIFDGSTLYAIETPKDTAVQPGRTTPAPAIFRLADVYLAPGTLGCSVVDAAATASQALQAMVGEITTLAAQGARLNLDIGAVADYEFTQNFTDPTTALLTRFNNVDGIFSEQVGVQITVAEVAVFTADNDPFTTTNPSDLLDELAEYRGATPAQDAQGLTHLFTGRNLDGSTAGIAFVGSLCSRKSRFDALGRSFGSGLSEGRRGAAIDSLIAAHEIGHNFGAPHDGEAGSACETTPETFLMAPSINGSDQFSQCSIDQMQAEIASAACLQPIGAADVALTAAAPSSSVLAGIAFDYRLNVTNGGIDAATNVGVDVTPDSSFEIQAAVANAGTCNIANQSVSCALGDIAGGSSRQVTLTLRAATPGTHTVDGAVTADSDANPGNDSSTDTVTVVPAVDLTVSAAAATVALNEQTVVDAVIENATDYAATNVTVQATLSSGLRADAATLGGAACTVAAQTVSCPPLTLAGRATTDLHLTLTALATGSQNVSLSASADEAEVNSGNNDLALNVTVAAPTTADNGGGGGGDSWALISLLGLAAWARRFRHSAPGQRSG